jgi:hypothetical protein
MAGTKRLPIQRHPVHPQFTPEILRLFSELENTPRRQRDSKAFKDGEHELARKLDLVSEYWTVNSVLDTVDKPPWPTPYVAREHWFKCRAIRKQLLAATCAS